MRIAPVWEGTTGIQALDLLGRKIMLQKLRPFHQHIAEVYSYCGALLREGGGRNLRKHAMTLLLGAAQWQLLTYRIAARAGGDKDSLGVASVDYLMYAGYQHMGLHWLKMEVAAEKALASAERAESREFYQAKVDTSQFYFDALYPRTKSLVATMFTPTDSLMRMKPEHFSFDHAL